MTRLDIGDQERKRLQQWIDDPDTPSRLKARASVVLALCEGISDREIARRLGVARQTVALWRRRVASGHSALVITTDAPGRGRKPTVPSEVRSAVWETFCRSVQAGRQRSVRDLAREFGLSAATVHRTLKAAERQGLPRPAGGGDTPFGRRS